jgi:hypothetical protein
MVDEMPALNTPSVGAQALQASAINKAGKKRNVPSSEAVTSAGAQMKAVGRA